MDVRIAVCCLGVLSVRACLGANLDEPVSPLSGPTVKEPGVPGNSTRFTGGGRREGERLVDHRTFLKALDALRSDADAALHLTPDQESQIFVLIRDYRLAHRAYFEKNLNDIRDVRQVLEIRGDQPPTESAIRKGVDELRRNIVGDDAAAEQAMSQDAIKNSAREKARRIYEGAPRAADVHTKIWKILTPLQRDAISDTISSLVAQQEAMRREFLSPESGSMTMPADSGINVMKNDAMNSAMNGSMNSDAMSSRATRDDMMGAKDGALSPATTRASKETDPASLLGSDPAKIAADDPRLPERVRRRIRFMKPEARTEALTRYLADLKDELAQARAAAEKDKSAPPTVDKVNVPTPEKK